MNVNIGSDKQPRLYGQQPPLSGYKQMARTLETTARVGYCLCDQNGVPLLVERAQHIPADIRRQIHKGQSLAEALEFHTDISSLITQAGATALVSTAVRFADGISHMQIVRLGPSHIHIHGYLVIFAENDLSFPSEDAALGELGAALAATGTPFAIYNSFDRRVAGSAHAAPEQHPAEAHHGQCQNPFPDVLSFFTAAERRRLQAAGGCNRLLATDCGRKNIWVRGLRICHKEARGTLCLGYAVERAHKEAPSGSFRKLESAFPAVCITLGAAPEYPVLDAEGCCEELLGFPAGLLHTGRPVSFAELVHPCDRQRACGQLEATSREATPCRFTYLLGRDRGDDLYVTHMGKWHCDHNGNPTHFDGVIMPAKLAEQAQAADLQAGAGPKESPMFPFGLVGRSAALTELIRNIRKTAVSDECVLVLGESGAGKELAAKALHDAGPRATGPFISVNCGAIPENLMENEFFGHRKGAFSGAESDHDGLLAQAHGGTLFLDEIGEIPLSVQIKLLRAIEGAGFQPIGGNALQRPDFRLVAATNRNLQQLVSQGRMRQDFYYRINVLPLHIPPLRERKNDIPLLFGFFLGEYPEAPPMSGRLLKRIMDYDWPGNVRELRNAAMRYATLGELPPEIFEESRESLPDCADGTLKNRMAEVERRIVKQELARHRWSRTKTAEALGIDRRTLYEKIRNYRLDEN
ncbi:sigma-54 interaction domain-containing protein [Oleidesulfovibrio alaskensis]